MVLGYEGGSKAYRLYDPVGGKVVVSRDVVFDEAAAWKWEETETGEALVGGGIDDTFAVEHLVIPCHGAAAEQPPEPAVAADVESPAVTEAGEPPSPGRARHLDAPRLTREGSPGSPK